MPNGHGYTSGCQQEPVSIFKGSRPSLMGASWRVVTRRVGNRAPRPHDVLQSGFAHFAAGGQRWPPADPYSASPGLAAPRARLTHQDGPLVGRPPNDQSMAVGAVAEGVRLVAIAFEVFPGVGDQFLDVLLVLQRRLTSADLDFSLCQTGTVLKRGWLCDPLIRSFKRGSPNPSL